MYHIAGVLWSVFAILVISLFPIACDIDDNNDDDDDAAPAADDDRGDDADDDDEAGEVDDDDDSGGDDDDAALTEDWIELGDGYDGHDGLAAALLDGEPVVAANDGLAIVLRFINDPDRPAERIADAGRRPALANAPDGSLHAAYFDRRMGMVAYAVRGADGWTAEPTRALPDRIETIDLEVGADGVPHLAITTHLSSIYYLTRNAAGTWSAEKIAGTGGGARVELTPDGQVVIGATTTGACLYHLTDGRWEKTRLGALASGFVDFVIDAVGQYHVVYYYLDPNYSGPFDMFYILRYQYGTPAGGWTQFDMGESWIAPFAGRMGQAAGDGALLALYGDGMSVTILNEDDVTYLGSLPVDRDTPRTPVVFADDQTIYAAYFAEEAAPPSTLVAMRRDGETWDRIALGQTHNWRVGNLATAADGAAAACLLSGQDLYLLTRRASGGWESSLVEAQTEARGCRVALDTAGEAHLLLFGCPGKLRYLSPSGDDEAFGWLNDCYKDYNVAFIVDAQDVPMVVAAPNAHALSLRVRTDDGWEMTVLNQHGLGPGLTRSPDGEVVATYYGSWNGLLHLTTLGAEQASHELITMAFSLMDPALPHFDGDGTLRVIYAISTDEHSQGKLLDALDVRGARWDVSRIAVNYGYFDAAIANDEAGAPWVAFRQFDEEASDHRLSIAALDGTASQTVFYDYDPEGDQNMGMTAEAGGFRLLFGAEGGAYLVNVP